MKKNYILFFLMLLALTAAIPAQSKAKTTAQKKNVTSDIRKVDFKNFDYTVYVFSQRGETARLRNGAFYSGELNCEFDEVIYGDLTSDAKEEAVVLLNCNAGGTGGVSVVYVYTMSGGKASLIGNIGLEEGDDVGTRSAVIKSGLLTIDRFVAGSGDANCCPSYHRSTTYRVSGNKLIKVSQSRRTKI